MHPIEAFFLILPYVPMLIFLNLSDAGWAIEVAVVLFWNELLHLSHDPFPKNWTRFWGRWLIIPLRHLDHHHNPDANFGLFFTYWDRLMKTDASL